LTEGIAEEAHCSSNFFHSDGKFKEGEGGKKRMGKHKRNLKGGKGVLFSIPSVNLI
jgi:hypothetical protein